MDRQKCLFSAGTCVTCPMSLACDVKECMHKESRLTVEVFLLGPADFVRGGLAHGFADC